MFSQNIWEAELGLDPRPPAHNPSLWLPAQPPLILGWEKQLGLSSSYWARQATGDRVTVFTIMYYLGLGCDLRWTQAANSEAPPGLNNENPRAEKHLRFGFYYCGFSETSVAEVYGTSSAALISCPQYFTTQERRQESFLYPVIMIPHFLLTNSSKIIHRTNRKGKTFPLKCFYFSASYCVAAYLDCVLK